MVRNNEPLDSDESLRSACEQLMADTQQLRRIGALNIIRASNIAEAKGDEEVVNLLLSEAAVMMSVASQIEWLFSQEGDGHGTS